ncbi:glycosyltransferase [Roseisolibacter agri]|uniref:Transferase n=1 Tax=Roseisolibacter agri TaxID=2014610 RepID=A0AA37Q9I2_9BACT|nr:glycosyltransferase [Roseisolibacter agri]GLC27217.1 transferase [Roseisolibacter agri]
MRVLFVAHSYPRHAGDLAGSFLLRLAVALKGEGVDVRVLAPAAAGLALEDVIEGVQVRRFRYAPRSWETLAYTGAMAEEARGSARGLLALAGLVASGARAIRREVREWRPDVVHAHWWFPGGLSAALPGGRGRTPLVVTMHGSDVRLAAGVGPARTLFARVVRQASAVTAVSRWLREQAIEMAPGLACDVAPMPVDVARFALPEPGTPRDGLLFVGRLTAQKGVDALLQALARAAGATTLTIVGSGPEEAALRALADRLGVASRVRWVPSQPQERLGALYGAAQALVIPSREEGLGLVAVEAQLCGTPVIAFASGGLVDVVHHERDGLLVPAGDVDALATAIGAVLGDSALARRLGSAGRDAALTSFAPSAVAARYRTIYEHALAAR